MSTRRQRIAGQIGRWGLRSIVAAVTAAVLARITAKKVLAADRGPLILGTSNSANSPTELTRPSGPVYSDTTFRVVTPQGSPDGVGIEARIFGRGTGIKGLADSGEPGVYGYSTGGMGVRGATGDVGPGQPAGVRGDGLTFGVVGRATGETGVGVRGDAASGHGVHGSTFSGTGVYGRARTGRGVVGHSRTGIGVRGESASGTAVVGVATAPGGQAARFSGPVTIEGSLTVVGGPKSAAVPRPDGSLRRMYCLESTSTGSA